MAREIQKGRGLSIFLAHEQQGHERREKMRTGGQFKALKAHKGTDAIAKSAVPDLVVVLREDHIVRSLKWGRCIPMASPPVARILAGVIPALLQCARQGPHIAEILVVSRGFPGQQRMHGVMKVVAPLRCHLKSALAPRTEYASVVQIAFGNHRNVSPNPCGESVYFPRQLRKKRERACVKNSVNGVESQRVNVKIVEPVERVLDEEMAHLITVRTVKVQRRSPGRFVTIL